MSQLFRSYNHKLALHQHIRNTIYYIIGLLLKLNSDVEFLLVPRDSISPQIIRRADWVITQFLRCPGKISAGAGFTFRSPGAVNGTSRNFFK